MSLEPMRNLVKVFFSYSTYEAFGLEWEKSSYTLIIVNKKFNYRAKASSHKYVRQVSYYVQAEQCLFKSTYANKRNVSS